MFVPATGKSRTGMRNALGDLGREILNDGESGLGFDGSLVVGS
jgi:hypothetical protein